MTRDDPPSAPAPDPGRSWDDQITWAIRTLNHLEVPRHTACPEDTFNRLAQAHRRHFPETFGPPPSREEIEAALILARSERAARDLTEVTLIEARMDIPGTTWSNIADLMGFSDGTTAQQHYRDIGGSLTWFARQEDQQPGRDE